ncbi:MAG: glycosyltransferase family 4 protein, partial [Anaerolineales bacterium]
LGMLSNPMAIRIFEKMEYQMAANATGLTVHSPGNIKHIVKHGGHAGCIDVVYNWVDPTRIKPKPKLNSFAQNYKLTDLFVVSYAGTMGWAQDMMTIVKSAALLRDEPKIVFLLVGDGVEKQKAQEEGKRLKLQNIVWLPMQPWRVYPEILASSNLSMINLHPSLKTPVVPSKLISIMAAARPVIACLPAESDARKIIDKAGCGLCVDAGDAKALSTAIIELSSNPELAKQLGHKGRIYMESNFARSVCTRKMEAVLILARRKSKYFTSKHSLLL